MPYRHASRTDGHKKTPTRPLRPVGVSFSAVPRTILLFSASQIYLWREFAGEAVHEEVDEPDPVEWFALHPLHDGAAFVDFTLEFDEVFEQFFAAELFRLEHVMVGVVLVPVHVAHARFHLFEVRCSGERRYQ